MTDIVKIQDEINKQIANKQVYNALVTTTFKGLELPTMKRAMMEGMMRGFKFQDFLEKNIYALPFKTREGQTYSLVTSIDYARKVGMRSGVVGKSEPRYEFDENGKVVSCTITVKKKVEDYIGDYTATVFFDEYFRGGGQYKNLWDTKPKTMIAKVAEMHALRMACPEELSQAYIEEDLELELPVQNEVSDELHEQIQSAQTVEELTKIYHANKGKGKEITKLLTQRKNEITRSQTEDPGVDTIEA